MYGLKGVREKSVQQAGCAKTAQGSDCSVSQGVYMCTMCAVNKTEHN